jgi:alpha-glucosidase
LAFSAGVDVPVLYCPVYADGTSPRVQIEVWSLHVLGYVMQSPSMLRAVEAVTALTGRQQVLPEWTQLGAVVGLEGGTANVTAIVDSMYAAGVPMAGEFPRRELF